MKRFVNMKLTLIFSLLIVAVTGFSGCSKNEVAEVYPPIVFKAIPGDFSGGAIADNLTVTVVNKQNGKRVPGAVVFVHQGDPMELKAKVETDDQGVASFSGQGITGPVTVTVTSNTNVAYDTVSVVNINASKLTIPIAPRKDPGKVKTALTFIGLDSGDEKLALTKNDTPYKEKVIKSGKLEQDPLTISTVNQPINFSAMATDAGGNTSKFGFTVQPDGPIPVGTPAMVNMVRISQDNVKMCSGSMENPPANLDEPTEGWDPYKRYIFQVYGDAGIAGNVVAGFANLAADYNYQAFIVNPAGLDNMKLEVSAMNRTDAWAEMSTAIKHFSFGTAPANHDFKFMNVPKNLQIAKVDGQILPNLVWESAEGNLTEVEIFHGDYNYHWTIYMGGENINKVVLPPLELGSPGAMIADEIYRFRVTKSLVPGMDFNNTTMQAVQDNVTNIARSTLVKFMVKAPEEK